MNNKACPRCGAEKNDTLLYKCVKCFTIYCQDCENTNGGRLCPACGMSHRMLLTPEPPAKQP